jgi:hypothetical protein
MTTPNHFLITPKPLRCFSHHSDVFLPRSDVFHSTPMFCLQNNTSERSRAFRTFPILLRTTSTSFPHPSIWLFMSPFCSICLIPFAHVPISCPSYLLGIYSCTYLVASQFEYRPLSRTFHRHSGRLSKCSLYSCSEIRTLCVFTRVQRFTLKPSPFQHTYYPFFISLCSSSAHSAFPELSCPFPAHSALVRNSDVTNTPFTKVLLVQCSTDNLHKTIME